MLAAATVACRLGGDSWRRAVRRVAAIGVYPAGAMIAFLIFSRIVVGRWFVSSGFFVPENAALGDPLLAARQIVWGMHALSGDGLILLALAGLAGLMYEAFDSRPERLIALAPLAAAALP